jgi:hypothetical protein
MASTLPTSPKGSRFGWPKPTRLEEFEKRLAAKGLPTMRVVIQGQPKDIPIIRVPIGLPKYRMANGRTASLQVEHLAKHPELRRDLFSGDAELWDAQEAQHRLLVQLGRQADLSRYFEDTTNKQVSPILLDENGFVVNGNRASCWSMRKAAMAISPTSTSPCCRIAPIARSTASRRCSRSRRTSAPTTIGMRTPT